MVSSRITAIIRKRVNTFLTERCSIERESGTKGRMGEPLHDWETVATDVPYRAIQAGTSNTTEGAAVGSTEALIETLKLIFMADTALAVDYRVRLADDRVYQIVDIEDRLTDGAFVSVLAVRAR
jgi:Phage head-tail joining protein